MASSLSSIYLSTLPTSSVGIVGIGSEDGQLSSGNSGLLGSMGDGRG
jgi:hypothetical protein